MSDATAFDERSRSDDPARADDRFRRKAVVLNLLHKTPAADETQASASARLSLSYFRSWMK